MDTRKITVMGVLKEGISIGIKNLVSLLVATILWILTIWVPYINVGTTIAMSTIPIELSKGNIISPLFIFDSKYRRYIGEYFTLQGMMFIAMLASAAFLFFPMLVVAIGWSLAVFILLDKGVAPGEALVRSNKATYGYKWTIFGVYVLLALVWLVLNYIFGLIPFIGFIFCFVIAAFYGVFKLGCDAVIYKNLVLNDSESVSGE